MARHIGTLRGILLSCGAGASVLYLAMCLFVPMRWADYSSFSQTISELSAIGAPTRPLWVPLGIVYTLLVAAFGAGIVAHGRHEPWLRVLGWVFIANGLVGLWWPPMHQRAALAAGGGTLTDTLHLVWAAANVAMMFLQMALAAAIMGKGFRRFSIVMAAMLLVGGAMTFEGASRVALDLPTPWLGVWERINVLGFMVWQAAFAIVLLRVRSHADDEMLIPQRAWVSR